MKAFTLRSFTAQDAHLTDIPEPFPGEREVIVEVAACGVCGSDLHAHNADAGYEWIQTPVVLGHEFAGTVVGVGERVTRVATGDTVAGVAIQGCLDCSACEAGDTHLCSSRKVIGLSFDGAMAQRVKVHEAYLVQVQSLPDLSLGALIEPLSVAVHAVLRRSRCEPGMRVVVSGPGPIGLLSGFVAKLCGATVYMLGTQRDAALRLPAAERLGLVPVNLSSDILTSVLPEAPDTWIEASGNPAALEQAVHGTRRGGTITVVGLYAQSFAFFPTTAVRSELSMNFSYASNHHDYAVAADLLAQHAASLEHLVQRYPLDEAPRAFFDARSGNTIKPVLIP